MAVEDDLLATCRALAAAGLVTGAAGNVSARDGDEVLLTGSGARLGEIAVTDLVRVDRAGDVTGGTLAPTSELHLHLEVYRRRPEVAAVVHTHGRHAVALSTVATEVPALHYYCLDLGGPVPVAGYRTYGTRELAEVTADALGARGGVVMAHHGSVTVGSGLAQAAARAELLEWLCEVALLARAAGTPSALTADDLAAVVQRAAAGR